MTEVVQFELIVFGFVDAFNMFVEVHHDVFGRGDVVSVAEFAEEVESVEGKGIEMSLMDLF